MTRPTFRIVRWLPHLAAVLVILACARLAVWQFDRADQKRALLEGWQQAPAVALDQAQEHPDAYPRVHARGRFDGSRQVLLDNQILDGRAGVHVFTPFRPEGTTTTWLVNRGWYPLPDRRGPLPAIDAPSGRLDIGGRLAEPPRVGFQLGKAQALDADHWPQLVTYLDLDRVGQALGNALARRVILLDPAHPAHLSGRAWRPVVFGPERHLAYAWQWATMALAVFLIWIVLSWHSFRKS